ncbi:ABC transporter ATP-binding protein [Corynebacterium auriscanis]|uniref:ABC transporter ATP-binding protein n=1 Tax=Corynebacterium auriscanis TaxID=99807 RepID=UPI002246A3DB|nr:ABC transporter ATP-binding protein [Corynebacterium auriscanis]MCX2162840.1 energy-coupling factor ABC transporter ATP-binding protein [Corynebacterium auriscanis]
MGAEIVLDNFGWRHAGRRDPAIAGINARIAPGEKVMLLGTSGAGKSTLLAGIAGVLGDVEEGEAHGHVTIDGELPQFCRGRVGMVLQDPDSQVIAARVGDDIIFGCENLGVDPAEMWRRARQAVRTVGLDSIDTDIEAVLARPTERLSGGQKHRLALAGVLAMQPGVIVLDEPTANLDPQATVEVRDAVIAAAKTTGATLVVVEHRVGTWVEHMDRAIVLGATDGETPTSHIIADGPIDQILRQHGEQLAASGMWVPGVPIELEALDGGASTQKNLVTTHDLKIGWNANHPVQQELNLQLPAGSTVLTGDNGAGKSTLALTVAGLLRPVAGQVNARGLMESSGPGASGMMAGGDTLGHRGAPNFRRPSRHSPHPHAWKSRDLVRRIGFVFQSPEHQFAARTVREELLLGPATVGMDSAEAEQRADDLLAQLRLSRLAKANPYTLSGGEKRRLSVAAMLATRPRLLILDEPTFGQDRATFHTLVRLFQQLVEQEYSLLSITHDRDFRRLMGTHEWRLTA